MASWITHLRVAEELLKHHTFNREPYLVGNLGPDCGVPIEHGLYVPSKKITHFLDESAFKNGHVDGTKIDAEMFYETYIKNQVLSEDQYAFLYGYYTHLLTDIEWSRTHQIKRKDPEYVSLFKDLKNIGKSVRQDWYGIDFMYLNKNPNHCYFTDLLKVEVVEDHLDYFPENALLEKVNFIKDFYQTQSDSYTYTGRFTTETDVVKFVFETSSKLVDHLQKRF